MLKKDGVPIGAISCFACHQCTVNELETGYSGDYASVLSEQLKKKYGKSFVSLFLIGTCGDVNHLNPDLNVPRHNYKTLGPILADSVIKSQESRVPVTGTVASQKVYVNVPRRNSDPAVHIPNIEYWLSKWTHRIRIP